MKLQLKLRIPKIEEFLLFFYLTYMMWKNIFFSKLPSGWVISTALLVLLIFASYFKNQKDISQYIDVFVLYLTLIILFLFKFVGNPDMEPWILRDYGLVTMISWGGIFGYAVIRIQQNLSSMIKCIKAAGIVLLFYYAWQSTEVIINGVWTYEQFGITRITTSNMTWSYGVLAVICYVSLFYFENNRKEILALIGVCLLGIMLYGSRGTIIAFILGLVFIILFYHDKKLGFKNYVVLVLFSLLMLYIFSDAGINQISQLLASHGMNSRFIDSILHYTTFEDSSSGRFIIWMPVINMIRSGPFYGYGVYGERNVVYATGLKWGYSHNLFLELLVDFGWLFGTIILVFLVIQIVRFFVSSNNKREKLIFIIFMTLSLELLLSNSLWLHSGFWIMIGLLANHFNFKKRKMLGEYQQ